MAIGVIGIYLVVCKLMLHSMCPAVFLTGLPCPACGLTRAGRAVLHGQFQSAWEIHPFIYVFIGFGIFFLLFRYGFHKEMRYFQKYLILIILGMIVFYIYRMIRYFPSEPPMSYYYGSVMSRVLHYFGLTSLFI